MQFQAKDDRGLFQLIAGHPVLDFVNTLDWRFRTSGSQELLNDYSDLLRFVAQSGLMSPTEVRKLVRGGRVKQKRSLWGCKKLRECLASILYAIADKQAPPSESMRTLSVFAQKVRESERLQWCDSRLHWKPHEDRADAPDAPLQKLVAASLDLLTSAEITKLSSCSNPECRWLFLDRSKNKGRRWCDMRLCGNRIKARQYRQRKRALMDTARNK